MKSITFIQKYMKELVAPLIDHTEEYRSHLNVQKDLFLNM